MSGLSSLLKCKSESRRIGLCLKIRRALVGAGVNEASAALGVVIAEIAENHGLDIQSILGSIDRNYLFFCAETEKQEKGK